MKALYDTVSIKCSRLTTKTYSTSFSIGIWCLSKVLHDPIYAIYGFVRFADEIVDSFHGYNKKVLLERFKNETYLAISEKISMNPILNSFQATVNRFLIDKELIDLFLQSMEMDLEKKQYDEEGMKQYILGSAEVVGLMCLRVFCNGNDAHYEKLKPYAMSLGSAFQKVNFLRDLNADFAGMGRTYFPELEINRFDDQSKRKIEESIELDFHQGYLGIRQLPQSSRFGVYVAYVYYRALFKKIKNTPSEQILQSRIRIRNRHKAFLLAFSFQTSTQFAVTQRVKLYRLKTKQFLPISNQQAWEFFSSPTNLALITPKRLNFQIVSISPDGEMHEGQIIQYKITVLPFVRMLWETEITEVNELRSFTDVQRKGPYSHWAHKHIFTKVDGGIEMTDELEYAIPLGLLGRWANSLFVGREVKSIFNYRFRVLNEYFKKTT